MHRTIPLLFLLAALALPGASQAAIRTVDYQVVIAGTADYNRADADEEASAQHDETVDFRTTIPKLTFHGRVADDSAGALGTATVRRGSYLITGASGQVRCATHEIAGVTGGGLDATFAEDRTVFAARVIDSLTVAVGGCDVAGMRTWQLPLTSGGTEVAVGGADRAGCCAAARSRRRPARPAGRQGEAGSRSVAREPAGAPAAGRRHLQRRANRSC